MVRRRHVFYVAGYDPQGLAGYYVLFRRELERARKIWPIEIRLTEPESDANGITGRWIIDAAGPNWSVATTYEFLRWEDIVVRDMSRPMWIRVPRAILCFLEYLFNGTLGRVFLANWRFGIFYIYPTACLLIAIAIPALLGGFVASLSLPHSVLAGVAVALGAFLMTRGLADRGFAIQFVDLWLWHRDWAHGRRGDFLARLDVFARRIIARSRAADVDEIVVVGHSAGGTCVIPLIARALEIDPGFARAGPQLTVFGLGSQLPLAALHPLSTDVREAIRRVAVEPSLRWVECQTRKDVINFPNFDPLDGVGIRIDGERRNPVVWMVRFRDLLAPELYRRLRWNFFRMHFQFIMANDRRGPYDYFMMMCGPAQAIDWATNGPGVVGSFSESAAYDADHLASPATTPMLPA